MAEESAEIPSMDYAEHERTFAGFVALTKLGILAIFTTLVGILIVAYAGSGFFKFVGFFLIFAAYIVAFIEFRAKASGAASLILLVLTLGALVLTVA